MDEGDVSDMFETKYVIDLTDTQRALLSQIIKEGIENEFTIRRAKIILMSDVHYPIHYYQKTLAHELDTSATTVQKVWTTYGRFGFEAALYGKPRGAFTAKLNDRVRQQILDLATGRPPEGYARWTYQLLARTAVALGIVDSIAVSSVKRILKNGSVSLDVKPRVQLSDEDRKRLEALVTEKKVASQTIRRAKILLLADGAINLSNRSIAQELRTNGTTVEIVLSKYEKDGVDAAVFPKVRADKNGKHRIN